ncbi:glycerophosphodiester phosphodiesterase family protein [Emcibacter sp.]|uniref:glycerophosphodiester phosphodiesterase family protein n=1 Tax=Emcibacter sp. TaxID=1979954 RepID=UPI002AA8D4E9|nr:glycerophosphodiester phosphodiesterase family protein [Emcibacter sp.]
MSVADEPAPTLTGEKPVIIAHRGASGYRPEHTLASYQLAIDMGADYIEPDLVMTKDGVMVARHDRYLGTTTDVAGHPEFADRKRQDSRTGRERHEGEDWFVEDFTLAELKTLRARQVWESRSAEFDGKFEIPTFEEILQLVQKVKLETGKTVGIYPETKAPGYFKSIGLDFEEPLLAMLKKYGYDSREDKIFIQSFEPEILENLKQKTDMKLIMLLWPDDMKVMVPNYDLDYVATFADGIGPLKFMLLDAEGNDNGLVKKAHELGLMVHPYTFRNDQLPKQFTTPREEYEYYFRMGIDGLFSDFSDTALAVRDSLY